ncbi:hypothetical protein D3C85_1684390 [compost metagenome]
MVDLRSFDFRLGQCGPHGPWHEFGDALVAHPALFPGVVDVFSRGAEVVDEIDRDRAGAQVLCQHLVATYLKRGGAVAEVQLL